VGNIAHLTLAHRWTWGRETGRSPAPPRRPRQDPALCAPGVHRGPQPHPPGAARRHRAWSPFEAWYPQPSSRGCPASGADPAAARRGQGGDAECRRQELEPA